MWRAIRLQQFECGPFTAGLARVIALQTFRASVTIHSHAGQGWYAMPHRFVCGLRSAPLLTVAICALVLMMSASADAAIPPVFARIAGFHGRITYEGHRTDVPNAPEVQGSASIGDGEFSMDERAPAYSLHADERGAVLHAGALTARSGNPLDADILVNPWPIALATLASGGLIETGPTRWEAHNGFIIYVDRTGIAIDGLVPTRTSRVAFIFDGWSDVGGFPAPLRIVRLRSGVQDATFQIDRFDVVRAADRDRNTLSPPQRVAHAPVPARALARRAASAGSAPPFPWFIVITLFGSLALGIAIVAWFVRDAFAAQVSARAAHDPRGWRSTASAAFVGPDGVLLYEGNRYHVGPEFFARSVEVKHSALFLQITAPGVSKAVVLPRRLPQPWARTRHRAAANGLSLIETLISMAFFTTVIVGGVYPALMAISHADLVAAQKRAAMAAVENALTDEEIACAYGTTTPTGTTSTVVDGMTVTVTLTDSSTPNARDILATATDAQGRVLAAVATTVGPPVPPPGSTSAPPAPSATPASPQPTTTPPSGSSSTPTPPPSSGSSGGDTGYGR